MRSPGAIYVRDQSGSARKSSNFLELSEIEGHRESGGKAENRQNLAARKVAPHKLPHIVVAVATLLRALLGGAWSWS